MVRVEVVVVVERGCRYGLMMTKVAVVRVGDDSCSDGGGCGVSCSGT